MIETADFLFPGQSALNDKGVGKSVINFLAPFLVGLP